MATTPQEFFSKNLKYITIGLFVLFLFKSVQSCNRDTALSIDKKQYIHVIDSLDKKIRVLDDSVKDLNTELKIANIRVQAAEKNVNDVNKAASNKSDVYVTNKITPNEPQK